MARRGFKIDEVDRRETPEGTFVQFRIGFYGRDIKIKMPQGPDLVLASCAEFHVYVQDKPEIREHMRTTLEDAAIAEADGLASAAQVALRKGK